MSEDTYMEDEYGEEGMPCFGEYNQWPECPNCILREKCKKFTEAEKQVSLRHKGKYSGRGKEKRRDRY